MVSSIVELIHWLEAALGKCSPTMNMRVDAQQQQRGSAVGVVPCSRTAEWGILVPPLGRDMLPNVVWTEACKMLAW